MRDLRPWLTAERLALVDLLAGLTEEQWTAPTEAGHWRVGDVARHLLDDDLGLLSRWRDGDTSGFLPMDGGHETFVAALDAKNERWVAALAGLSQPVVGDLLAWSGAAADGFLASVDLGAPRHVSWAGGEVPAWLDIAREHTERWVHGRHIADAVRARLGPDPDASRAEVLRTFAWAFPAQLASAPPGTSVGVALGGDRWAVTRGDGAWSLEPGWPRSPAASLVLDGEAAWRHLTGLPVPTASIDTAGDPALVASLLAVRSIIV